SEADGTGQVLTQVTEVVFPELAGLVPLGLEQLGDCDVAGLKAFLRPRQADLEHSGAKADLAGDEGRPAGGAALLPVPVGEQGAFLGNAVDVRGLVTHHALVGGTDVPVADVVTPQHENVRLLRGGLRHRRAAGGQHEIQCEKGKQYSSHSTSSSVPPPTFAAAKTFDVPMDGIPPGGPAGGHRVR